LQGHCTFGLLVNQDLQLPNPLDFQLVDRH